MDLKTRNHSNPDAWQIVIPGLGCQFFGDRLRRIVSDLIRATGCKVSRVDAAVDLRVSEDSSLEPTFRELEVIARDHTLRQASGIQATDKGTTVSFGSRSSDRYVRIYDKGAEQGIDWWKWLRYEAEFKGDVAEAMTFDLLLSDDWTEWAHRAAAGAIPEFRERFPDLGSALFDCQAYRPTVAGLEVELDKWIKTVQEQYGGRIQMLSQATGCDPYEIARALELFETKPTKRLARHSGFLVCAKARLDDIIKTHEPETNQSDQGQGSSGDPANGYSTDAPEHRVVERTKQGGGSFPERVHRQTDRLNARDTRRFEAGGDL